MNDTPSTRAAAPGRAADGRAHLNAELRAVLTEMDRWPALPPLDAQSAPLYRVATYREQAFDVPYGEVAEVRELVATGGPVPVRIKLYVPRDRPSGASPAVVRLHGGGTVMGSPENDDRTSRLLANRTGCMVLAAAYRLAPEHPFPAGALDCQTAIRWVIEHAGELSIDADRIAVLGHSAGGLLALTSAIVLAAAAVRVAGYVALEPMTGPHVATASRREFATGHLLTAEEIDTCWRLYLDGSADTAGSAPAEADAVALRRLDPVWVLTSEFDPLRDEGELFAERLRAAGGRVRLQRLAGSIHGAASLGGVSQVGRDALDTIVEALQGAWSSRGRSDGAT